MVVRLALLGMLVLGFALAQVTTPTEATTRTVTRVRQDPVHRHVGTRIQHYRVPAQQAKAPTPAKADTERRTIFWRH